MASRATSDSVQDVLDEFALLKLARRMRYTGGVKQDEHRVMGRKYKKCFSGAEAVEWIRRDGFSGAVHDREDALAIANMLIRSKLMIHISGDPSVPVFDDDKKHFYQFNDAELGVNLPSPLLSSARSLIEAVSNHKALKGITDGFAEGKEKVKGAISGLLKKDKSTGPPLKRGSSSWGVEIALDDGGADSAEDHSDDEDEEDDKDTEVKALTVSVRDLDTKAIAQRMLADKSFVIKDRRWGFSLYKKVFIGKDAVQWFLKDTCGGAVKREEDAVGLGNVMLQQNIFHLVGSEKKKFKNKRQFYRFSVHDAEFEEKDLGTVAEESEEAPLSHQATFVASAAKAPAFESYIQIRVIEAKEIRAGDSGGTSDPYARVFVESHKLRTRTLSKTRNPVWNEEFKLHLCQKGHNVQIGIFDANKISSDEFLGMAFISLRSLEPDKKKDMWYPLLPRPGEKGDIDRKKKVTGSVHVEILYHKHVKDALKQLPEPGPEELEERRKKKETGFNAKALQRNIQRLTSLLGSLKLENVGKSFNSLIWWENPSATFFTWVIFLYVAWYAPPNIIIWAIPGYLLYVMTANLVTAETASAGGSLKRSRTQQNADGIVDMDGDGLEDYDVSEEHLARLEAEAEASKLAAKDSSAKKAEKKEENERDEGLLLKLKRIQRTLGEVNDSIDGVLSTFERFNSILQWHDKQVSWIFYGILWGALVAVYLLPFRLLLIVGGTLRIWKYWLKTPDERKRRFSTPNAALNIISHAPLPAELYLNEHSIAYELLKA